MTKILVIDNQYTHFALIHKHLSNSGYEVFPLDNDGAIDFKRFLDLIRVYLNDRYGGLEPNSRRQAAYGKVLGIVQDTVKPDLIILDLVLVGNHDGKKGTFLAKAFRNDGISVPIIFLSRSEKYQQGTISEYDDVAEPKEWVHKGYSGLPILEETFFKREVTDKFEKLWARSRFIEIAHKVKYLFELDELMNLEEEQLKTDIYSVLSAILNDKDISVAKFNVIEIIYAKSDRNIEDWRALSEAS